MLPVNIDISDRFINCQLRSLFHFSVDQSIVTKPFKKVNNENAGLRDTQHGKSI